MYIMLFNNIFYPFLVSVCHFVFWFFEEEILLQIFLRKDRIGGDVHGAFLGNCFADFYLCHIHRRYHDNIAWCAQDARTLGAEEKRKKMIILLPEKQEKYGTCVFSGMTN